ncbi:hypothetical protein Btru_009056 [Bulinus truncatus]|nr:hypothetical protein Btru_009056 [Bulinus truncatus]
MTTFELMFFAFLVLACWHDMVLSQNVTSSQPQVVVTESPNDNRTALPTWHEHIHQDGLNESHVITFNVTIDSVTKEESLFFIKKIFSKYGDPGGLKLSDLTELLRNLGLGSVAETDSKKSHKRRRKAVASTHLHTHHSECLSISQILEAFHLASEKKISEDQFTYLCPALVYQLDSELCHSQTDDKHHSSSHSDEDHKDNVSEKFDISEIPGKVWGFSFLAVVIISLCGLFGVAVIPIMQKVFYNHLLQFLVALAIGALTGDALLHLLPHAIMGGSHDHSDHETEDHDHSSAAWKGLMALAGILFFFVTERLLTILTVIKRNKHSTKQEKKKRCEKFCDIESNKASVGAKLTNRQSSQYECDQTVMLVHPNKALKSYADTVHEECKHQCDDEVTTLPLRSNHKAKDDEAAMELMEVSKTIVDYRIHGSGHSHGHGHGHGHSVPNSVSSVAWMVILGDGIHNFADGLAIGAAFASSITGGISTSIAVFCHELPHEIGDFAVLLRAGMTVKQAVVFNCLSSILCLLGMLIGVAIVAGNEFSGS